MTSPSKKDMIFSGNKKVDAAYHTAEWLLSAFTSVLVFIVFVMQVYRIPTGSMAETLRGAHFRLRCTQCGCRYDHDFIHHNYRDKNNKRLSNTVTPTKPIIIQPRSPRCPSCGYSEPDPLRSPKPPVKRTVFKGDQIFVQKCIYQFTEPKRWDVIVFKNPTEPKINYIKRCIGLPGEKIEIIDGDVFANGIIQRKPEKVQEELWMVIYDNDYQPINPSVKQFNGHTWKQPFEKVGTSKWNLNADGPRVFALDADSQTVQRIQYNDKQGNNFQAAYAFDDPGLIRYMPVCSDLMVRYYMDMQAGSAAGAQIKKYGIAYEGWVEADGTMRILRLTPGGSPIVAAEGQCNLEDLSQITRFRFATVDHQVVLECGDSKLIHDLGTGINDAGTNRQIAPQLQILGKGKIRLTHIGLFRDIHYITENPIFQFQQGSEQKPMILKEDEYFACGDNSPASADSRLWNEPGLGNNGHTYPQGVVPKDYLVGKAMVVHWPGGYRWKNEWLRWIPSADDFKVIYGGSSDESNN